MLFYCNTSCKEEQKGDFTIDAHEVLLHQLDASKVVPHVSPRLDSCTSRWLFPLVIHLRIATRYERSQGNIYTADISTGQEASTFPANFGG